MMPSGARGPGSCGARVAEEASSAPNSAASRPPRSCPRAPLDVGVDERAVLVGERRVRACARCRPAARAARTCPTRPPAADPLRQPPLGPPAGRPRSASRGRAPSPALLGARARQSVARTCGTPRASRNSSAMQSDFQSASAAAVDDASRDRVRQRAGVDERRRLVGEVDHLQGVAQLQPVEARVREPSARRSTAISSSGWSAACSSTHLAPSAQNAPSGSMPSACRMPARCRNTPSKTSVKIGQRLLLVVDGHMMRRTLVGQRAVAEQRDLLADVLHEHAGRHVPVEHQDEVLAVRHERQLVGQQAVHERAQVGAQVRAHPVGRGRPDARTRPSRTRRRGVPVQQRGHRREPLGGGDQRHRALAPQRGEHLAVRARRGRAVVGVAGVADRRALAQHAEPGIAAASGRRRPGRPPSR